MTCYSFRGKTFLIFFWQGGYKGGSCIQMYEYMCGIGVHGVKFIKNQYKVLKRTALHPCPSLPQFALVPECGCNSRSSQEGAVETKKRCFQAALDASGQNEQSLNATSSWSPMRNLGFILTEGRAAAHRCLCTDGIWFCLSGELISLCNGAPVSDFQVRLAPGLQPRARD